MTAAATKRLANEVATGFGNLRTGLQLLAWAASIAEEANAEQLQETHITAAVGKLDRKYCVQSIVEAGYTVHQQAILAVLLDATRKDATPISTGELFEQYQTMIAATDESPLTKRRLRTNLTTRFSHRHVDVDKQPSDHGPDQWRATLACDPQVVETALREYGDLKQYREAGEEFSPTVHDHSWLTP